MRKILLLMMVLGILVVMSTGVLAARKWERDINLNVKWDVEPFFDFRVRVADDGGWTAWQNGSKIKNDLTLVDLGSVSPKNLYSGEIDPIRQVERAPGTVGMHISSNDNWAVILRKPAMTNRTQNAVPVDLYVDYYGYEATAGQNNGQGWSSGGWTTEYTSRLDGDMGYHLFYFRFGVDYENLLTRYGLYKSTVTYTGFQL